MTFEAHIERIIDAPVGDVFDAFTDASAIKEWYEHTEGWTVDVLACDVRVGGRTSVAFGPDGPLYREDMTYVEVEPPYRLVYEEVFTHPDGTTSETVVSVRFEAADDKTRIVVVHRGFESELEKNETENGWPAFLAKLENVVAKRRAA